MSRITSKISPEWSQIERVVYVVNDAERIGFDKPLVATLEDSALVNYIDIYQRQFDGNNTAFYEISAMSGTGTFYANKTSKWELDDGNPIELTAPSLNITLFEVDSEVSIPPEQVRHRYAYALDGRQCTLDNATYLLEHGSCKPSETYQWGFSYIFLFMVSIFNFVWSCNMVGMWLDTRRGSRMYKSGRRPGLLRSIMDYSAAIREELGTEVDYLEEEELRRRVRDSGGALVVPKTELRVMRASMIQVGTMQRSWKRSLTKGSTF